MNGIKLITLDLWNTLIIDVPNGGVTRNSLRVDGIGQILADQGQACTNKDILTAIQKTQKILWDCQLSGVDLSFDQQVDCFLNKLRGLDVIKLGNVGRDQITEKYGNSFFGCSPKLNKDVKLVLAKLKKKGFRIALVSNTGATPGRMLRVYLSRLEIVHYFELLVFSDEHAIAKPNPELFIRTLTTLGVQPSQSVHVGDQRYFDCDGAKQVGMKAILLDGIVQHVEPSQCRFEPDAIIGGIRKLPSILSNNQETYS